MDSCLEKLKESVQCSLCNDTLNEPKILKCFHTFCKPCIKRHAELINEVSVFKCPKCKSETYLPQESGLESLKTSPLHSRMSQILVTIESKKVCSVSDRHSAAVWYCFDCDQSICEDCLKGHSVFTKHHKLIRLNDMKNEDLESMLKKEINCTTHLNEMLELYCEDCDNIICLSCWKTGHKDHKIMSLDKLILLKRTWLYKHLQVLEQLRFNDKERREQEEIAYKIQEDGERAKREVQEFIERAIRSLLQSERELLRQVDSYMNRATKNLNIIHHIPDVEEYINELMGRGLASEMMNIQESECPEDFIFSPIKKCSGFAFIPNQTLLQQVNTGLGEIQSYSKTDHTMSNIQVEPDPVALKQGKLLVITKTSAGGPNYDPSDVIEVKISPEENVEIQENRYVKPDGKIEVEFMAKVAGQLTAEVQVNGNHVSNSPLVMNVGAQEMEITKEFKMKGRKVETLDMNGIAVNRENKRVAVADGYSQCVHVFNTDGDLVLTYGSQGSGQLQNPEGLAFLSDTDLVIANCGYHSIVIVNIATGKCSSSIGSSGDGNGQFYNPRGVDVDVDGNITVCSNNGSNHCRVQVFGKNGTYQYHFGRSPQFGYTNRDKFHPACVVTHDGRFYVSDSVDCVIYVFEKKDGVLTRVSTIGEKGGAAGQLSEPWGLAIDDDHHLLVCDRGNNRIQKFTLDGRFVKKSAKIQKPSYIAVLKDGQLLVSTYCSGVFYVK